MPPNPQPAAGHPATLPPRPSGAAAPAPLRRDQLAGPSAAAPVPELPNAVDGERRLIGGAGPRLAAYLSMPVATARSAALHPLLLVHSVNAAASAAEVRPVFNRWRHSRPVLALDLPGFGASQRGRLVYTPALMAQSIGRALAHLQQAGFHQRVDLMAVSLSCEFAAQVALAQPERVRSVALVSPTGLESARPERYDHGRSKDKPWLRALLERGPWAGPLFKLLTSESTMRRFLERAWGSPYIDESLLAYNLKSVRQSGACHAPYAFIAGALFTRGVASLYGQLRQPVWLAHGMRGEFADYDGLATLGPPPHWTVDAFDTGAMPYFERPVQFGAGYEQFLQRLPLACHWPDDAHLMTPA